MPSTTLTASGTWAAPSNLSGAPRVQVWNSGGNGQQGTNGAHSGAGGGSTAYAEEPALAGVTAGVTTLTITLGSGTATVTGGSVAVTANPGANASGVTPGAGGAAGSNTIATAGSSGGAGATGTNKGGGGGAGSPGPSGSGGAGGAGSASPGTAGSAGAGGGAAGGSGGTATGSGSAGSTPGSGGGGGGDNGARTGGTGGGPQVIITWSVVSGYPALDYAAGTGVASGLKKASGASYGYAAGTGTASGSKHTAGSAKGYAGGYGIVNPPPASASSGYAAGTGTASGVANRKGSAKGYAAGYGLLAGEPFNPGVINAWANSFAQPSSFGPMPPALQSINVPLNPTYATISGTGYPSQGNWLFACVGWNQDDGIPALTFGVADDIHSWWRPQVPSSPAGNTRSVAWYTANLVRVPTVVYVAPNGAYAGAAVLVVEVANLGPWDTVTGYDTNYAAGATSLPLTLPPPT